MSSISALCWKLWKKIKKYIWLVIDPFQDIAGKVILHYCVLCIPPKRHDVHVQPSYFNFGIMCNLLCICQLFLIQNTL